MIPYYHIPQPSKNIKSTQILTISQTHELKDAIYNGQILSSKVLNMKNSNINDQTLALLWPIPDQIQLITINLSQNFSFITDKAVDNICQCINLTSLKSLNLADNSITDLGLYKISKASNMIRLEELILYGNSDISSEGIIHLASSEYVKALKKLDLHDTSVCDKGMSYFLKLGNSANLQWLDLSMNAKKITDFTLQALATSRYAKNIRQLKLQDCSITDAGVQHLAQSQNSTLLQNLNLNNSIQSKSNTITNNSLQFIAYSKYMKKIKYLEFRHTEVGSKGLLSLSASLNSENIEVLRLSHCSAVKDDSSKYIESIMQYRSLTKIYLNSTGMTKQTAEEISNKYPQVSVIY